MDIYLSEMPSIFFFGSIHSLFWKRLWDDQLQAMADLASLPKGERVRVLGGKNFEKSASSVLLGGARP